MENKEKKTKVRWGSGVVESCQRMKLPHFPIYPAAAHASEKQVHTLGLLLLIRLLPTHCSCYFLVFFISIDQCEIETEFVFVAILSELAGF